MLAQEQLQISDGAGGSLGMVYVFMSVWDSYE